MGEDGCGVFIQLARAPVQCLVTLIALVQLRNQWCRQRGLSVRACDGWPPSCFARVSRDMDW